MVRFNLPIYIPIRGGLRCNVAWYALTRQIRSENTIDKILPREKSNQRICYYQPNAEIAAIESVSPEVRYTRVIFTCCFLALEYGRVEVVYDCLHLFAFIREMSERVLHYLAEMDD